MKCHFFQRQWIRLSSHEVKEVHAQSIEMKLGKDKKYSMNCLIWHLCIPFPVLSDVNFHSHLTIYLLYVLALYIHNFCINTMCSWPNTLCTFYDSNLIPIQYFYVGACKRLAKLPVKGWGFVLVKPFFYGVFVSSSIVDDRDRYMFIK